jgi:fatty acid desaturase
MQTNPMTNPSPGSGPAGARPYVPAHPSIDIDNAELSRRFEKFELGARKIRWDKAGPVRVDWSIFDRACLTLDNLFVVKLVTFVESYADVYTSLLLDKFCTNDTMSTFFQLWEREEQNHADQLVAYLHLVGLDKEELRESLARPRQKKFDVPYVQTPLQANVFTYCQELLTAFFYQMFRRTVKEPLLDELLTKIIADEWRHFHWYEGVVKQHLAVDRRKTLEEAMPVFENFAMPGNQILGAEYEILTDEIVKRMRFSTGEIFAIGRHVTSTFGLYEGGKLIARSSYARDMKDVMLRKKPPKPQHDEVVASFSADLVAALSAGAA